MSFRNNQGSTNLKIPDKWLDFAPNSKIICNKFVAFKTPLNNKYRIPMEYRFNTHMLFSKLNEMRVNLGLWIDLTNTNRYYDQSEVEINNCQYVKLPLTGHGIPPTRREVKSFLDICWNFVSCNPHLYIGVHCTHGLNRTGFLIVSCMVEILHYDLNRALHAFATARPPGIYRQSYIDELHKRYAV